MDAEGNRDNHSNAGLLNNSLDLTPVAPEQSGEGLPYAPENWPEPGDVWGWRTGKRVSTSGLFRDRYLYLPPRLSGAGNAGSGRRSFASKLSVERYVTETFPHVNLRDFFALFSWMIPSLQPGLFPCSDIVSLPECFLICLVDAVFLGVRAYLILLLFLILKCFVLLFILKFFRIIS